LLGALSERWIRFIWSALSSEHTAFAFQYSEASFVPGLHALLPEPQSDVSASSVPITTAEASSDGDIGRKSRRCG
jgi:hypothetical protein